MSKMPKSKKGSIEEEDDEEELDFEEEDDKKPVKKQKISSTVASGQKPASIELGGSRKVSVSIYHGKKYVDIREYYVDKATGEDKPGKKGISLTIDQWESLKSKISDIDNLI